MAFPAAAAAGAVGGIKPVMPHGVAMDLWTTGAANRQAGRTAQTEMNYNTWMANTAHQREVADLKAAGLNPNLSAGGSGAPSPTAPGQETFKTQIEMPGIHMDPMQQRKLDQDQQRINIDKGIAASTISKNLTGNELTKAKTLVEKQGVNARILGTDLSTKSMGAMKELKEWAQKQYQNWANPQVPRNTDSSAGELIQPPGMGQPKY